ncbi:hypothetical protein TcasGA2_TC001665 [Tribolium castaneum]|uniref:Uncharacterized protein n=1 Tax=Tribolium castaneum TaxID=7070 RepID=D6X1L2_TRICA|nr:hypothetical protein TcasGA2_TC001665 [Tribolium castaneum]
MKCNAPMAAQSINNTRRYNLRHLLKKFHFRKQVGPKMDKLDGMSSQNANLNPHFLFPEKNYTITLRHKCKCPTATKHSGLGVNSRSITCPHNTFRSRRTANKRQFQSKNLDHTNSKHKRREKTAKQSSAVQCYVGEAKHKEQLSESIIRDLDCKAPPQWRHP